MLQRHAGDQVLAPFFEVAFDHHAGDTPLAGRNLPGYVVCDCDLPLMLLAAVAVRNVDHQALAQTCGAQRVAARGHMRGVVVGRLASAQDDVAVVVAARFEDGGHAHLRHPHEGMRRACGKDGVGRNLDAAVGAVLEAHRAAQARGELTVTLALGRARADGAPGDQVGDKLRAQQIEELRARGQAERRQLQQQAPRTLQTFVDREAAVEVRVVDVTLPAHRRARLLEVGAHDNQQVVVQFVGHGLQAVAVFERLVVVVDRAGADHDDKALIPAMQHFGERGAARFHEQQCVVAHRDALLQQGGRDQRADGADAHVIDAGGVERAVTGSDLAIVEGVVEGDHGMGGLGWLLISSAALRAGQR